MSAIEDYQSELGPIRVGDVRRTKQLARELALGVYRELWGLHIARYNRSREKWSTFDNAVAHFHQTRWADSESFGRSFETLHGHGYVDETGRLTQSAFELLDESEPFNIFISYKRSESSAFALLVVARLKEHGLFPFVDMALEAGGNWHADLEERIKDNDHFIILLGKDTLSSPMTLKEILWALQYGKTIIPLWHSDFDINSDKWTNLPADVMDAIQQTNAIRVTDESASGYNTAIVELLNRFGITP